MTIDKAVQLGVLTSFGMDSSKRNHLVQLPSWRDNQLKHKTLCGIRLRGAIKSVADMKSKAIHVCDRCKGALKTLNGNA